MVLVGPEHGLGEVELLGEAADGDICLPFLDRRHDPAVGLDGRKAEDEDQNGTSREPQRNGDEYVAGIIRLLNISK